ncbi:MAG: hypothetical protein JXA09_05360 [Anaerolineae bacterium]|nr:hypothetical protein [Anaerolineae bacterium]
MGHATPHRVVTCQGEPVRVLGRTLTPVARVLSRARHHGTVREHAVDGHGWVTVHARPIRVIETHEGQERVLAIPDATRAAILQMALVSLAVSLASIALIALAQWLWRRETG